MTRAFGGAFRGRRALVTGLTGFKGSWLGLWLTQLGAKVSGVSLAPETQPSLFEQSGLAKLAQSRLGDIRDLPTVKKAFAAARPEVVFHLAAQPLVGRSYDEPLETFSANVLGTLNVLEAARSTPSVKAVVVVTTDKCYRNDRRRAFREDDPLGGDDPYSASKACAEIAAQSFGRSFFNGRGPRMSTARAGNVIGGGDWTPGRILPDCARALARGKAIEVRNPAHTRPWQFVLDPLAGYLWLAALQLSGSELAAGAWNFGPDHRQEHAVRKVVERAIEHWGSGRWKRVGSDPLKVEKSALQLDSSKARRKLGWKPVYRFDESVAETVLWYKASTLGGFSARELCLAQIGRYTERAAQAGARWAKP